MAEFVKRWDKVKRSPLGQIVQAALYLLMLCAVLVFFTGHGVFIYEGF